MGKELISASGKGHSAIATYWITFLILGIVFAIIFIFCANTIGYTHSSRLIGFQIHSSVEKNGAYYIFMILAVSSLYDIVLGYQIHMRVSKTAVHVYEDCIKGTSVSPNFPWLSMKLMDFHLNYDQISSVDVVDENTLAINAANVQHKIYAMNAREVRDVIVEQKNAVNKN
jgi:hypothetical protein